MDDILQEGLDDADERPVEERAREVRYAVVEHFQVAFGPPVGVAHQCVSDERRGELQ